METKSLFLSAITSAFLFTNTFSQAPEIEWQNTIGGDNTDYLLSLQYTNDGGCILGGLSLSGISGDKTEANLGTLYSPDYWVVKLNATGTIWLSSEGLM